MHTPTPVIFDKEAREKILKGAGIIYDSVRRTMGPEGGNVLMYGLYSRPYRITNDGYTVAEIIEIKDVHAKLAAEAIKDAAKRTNMLAGDGTSATTVISGKGVLTVLPAIAAVSDTADFEKALKKKSNDPKKGVMSIKRDLFATKDLVITKLKKMSKPVKDLQDLERIATISLEDTDLGKTVAGMSWKVGAGGHIDIAEGFNGQIETEVIEGARFPAKIPAKVFVNKPERYEMEMLDTPVFLTNHVVDKTLMGVVLDRLQGLSRLVILAPDFKDSALLVMAQINKKNGELIYAPVKVPSLKTVQFEDIEIFTGAKFFNKDANDKLEGITNADLGYLSKLVVKDADVREDAVAIGGKGTKEKILSMSKGEVIKTQVSPVTERIKMLTEQLTATRESGQKEILKRRIAGLQSAVGIIRVSRDSEAETYYWKKKIEDGVYACKAALEEGYLPGGGMALKEIADKLPDTDLLKPALLAPYEQIQENSGGVEIGPDVIDPTKAIRCAVEHAVSVIANLATVRVIIPEAREVTPGEGYNSIAAAIQQFVMFWAREKGIIQENEEEIYRDTMARHDAILRNVID